MHFVEQGMKDGKRQDNVGKFVETVWQTRNRIIG